MAAVDSKSFGQALWQDLVAVAKWIGARGLIIIIVIAAIVLVSIGFKGLQIGGLLGKLLGKKPDGEAIDIANSVPAGRVDANGKIIPPGTPDAGGNVQAVVVPIQDPGMFSNPGTVVFTPPGATQPVEVTLPTGVTNSDVQQVIIVKPSTYVVSVKDSSGIPAQTVDDLLKKYGA